MTLAIAVVTADGIVVAADSRTTGRRSPQSQSRVLSDFTHKVFRVKDVAVATYGFAFISGRNIAGHMGEFVRELEIEGATPNAVAVQLGRFFGERLEQHFAAGSDPRPAIGQGDALGFLVAGYEDGTGVLYEVGLPSMNVTRQTDSRSGGAAWRGQTDVMVRLIKGVDLNLLHQIAGQSNLRSQVEMLIQPAAAMEYMMPFNSMNLQDAIDFAVLAIRTTIDVQRLTHGTIFQPESWPGVGGPIEIAAVTPADGYVWVQRTTLQGERPAGNAEQDLVRNVPG